MNKRTSSIALSVLFLIAAVVPAIAEPPAPQNKLEPWQTDWKLYVAELGKDLQKGVDPGEGPHLKGKTVEFEGILREAFDPDKPDESLDVEMEPRQVSVMLKLFPLVDAAKAGERTAIFTVRKILVKPAVAARDGWKAIEKGSKVRFRGTIGDDAAVLATTSGPGQEPAGVVFLFLKSAEVILPK